MSGSNKLSESRVEAALKRTGGDVPRAAVRLGASLQTVRECISQSQHLQSVVKDIEEAKVDFAEKQVFRKLREGDRASAQWFLEHKGRERGYGRAGKDGPPLPPPANPERRKQILDTLIQNLDEQAKMKWSPEKD